MALIGLAVPAEISARLDKIKVDGKKETHHHITMFYFSEAFELKELFEILDCLVDKVSKTRPFTIKGDEVTTFPKGPDGVPVIIPIKSKGLVDLREMMAKILDKGKFEYSKRHPEYKPHLTLAYGEEPVERNISEVVWKVDRIVIWAGDDAEGLNVEIPFSSAKNAAFYIMLDNFCKTAGERTENG